MEEPAFSTLFGKKKVAIGVVHLAPLPGSPCFEGDFESVIKRATHDARIIDEAGFDAIIVENFGDTPFHSKRVEPQTIAAMAVVVHEIKKNFEKPVGVNVLRNDACAALAIASVCGCEFIRVNVLVGAYVTCEGIIESQAAEVMRLRKRIAPSCLVFADVMVKHATPLGTPTIGEEALDAVERGGAHCVIVTGRRTGLPPSGDELKEVKTAIKGVAPHVPVLVGSGVTEQNVLSLLEVSDGVIVGTYIKEDGIAGRQVDRERAVSLGKMIKSH